MDDPDLLIFNLSECLKEDIGFIFRFLHINDFNHLRFGRVLVDSLGWIRWTILLGL